MKLIQDDDTLYNIYRYIRVAIPLYFLSLSLCSPVYPHYPRHDPVLPYYILYRVLCLLCNAKYFIPQSYTLSLLGMPVCYVFRLLHSII